jgi:hypothetical protein
VHLQAGRVVQVELRFDQSPASVSTALTTCPMWRRGSCPHAGDGVAGGFPACDRLPERAVYDDVAGRVDVPKRADQGLESAGAVPWSGPTALSWAANVAALWRGKLRGHVNGRPRLECTEWFAKPRGRSGR